MSLVNKLKSRLYPIYRKHFSRVYLYEGVLKSGSGSVKCLFVDNDKFYLEVLQALYAKSPMLVRTFRCWIPGLERLLNSSKLDADICFANVPLHHAPLFHDSAAYIMQTRVRQTLDTTTELDANKRYRDRKRDVNRTNRKFGLTCRISHSPDDFDFFYHRMAKPLTIKFGDAAMEDTYDDLKLFFEKGVLLLVVCEGVPISGVLCYEHEVTFVAYRSGLLDGDPSYLKMGAMSAWYLFLIEYAREQGYEKVDFMNSIPFLNIGVYVTKQHWGATAESCEGATSWVYLFKRCNSETFSRIVENIPLIVHTQNGLEGVISFSDENDLTPEIEQKLTSKYGAPGLYGLQILRSNGAIKHIILKSHNCYKVK